ncbi:glucose-6-phosphate dehydrogenase [Viridibacterium curvum]|uniref:Glucose-6-phosphate 1-dehydrogenase n=1 Tax=Viridibacterium curvum TaxID=1101404 RepID=A0ABP9R4H0_9RHOO
MSAGVASDVVLFGGTGDLVMRKLVPALFHLHSLSLLDPGCRIIAVAREPFDDEAYRRLVADKARSFLHEGHDESAWAAFLARLEYVGCDVRDVASFNGLRERLKPGGSRLFYLSTTPALFSPICRNLSASGLILEDSRVIVEKPLGHDLASSQAINDEIGACFREDQIFRIDHYLGKEPVQNLLALRFGNSLFEPLWRREWVSDVQITVAETIGVGSRGEFYNSTGAMRDMIQNHILQLLCIVAMEPPASISPDAVRDEKLKVLRALRPIVEERIATHTVRGQYRAGAVEGQVVPGYLEEAGIPAGSRTETYVAIKAEIDSWRWAGVPFYLRTGKRMQDKLAEIVVNFRQMPHSIFGSGALGHFANRLVIQMQPNETVLLHMMAKQPGEVMRLEPVKLDLDFREAFRTQRLEAYARLLMDALRGNLTLFVRRDEQEAAWRWVEPVMNAWAESEELPRSYNAGTWGPAAASALLVRDGLGWHEEIAR